MFGDTLVLLLMNSIAWGAQICVRPPTGIWIDALVLSSITTTPCTTQPVIVSVKVTTKVSTVAGYTWLTLMGGTSMAPEEVGLPSPQSIV